VLRAEGTAPVAEAEALGLSVADELISQGAEGIIAEVYAR
jgi:hydroxymethylbilane synthase